MQDGDAVAKALEELARHGRVSAISGTSSSDPRPRARVASIARR